MIKFTPIKNLKGNLYKINKAISNNFIYINLICNLLGNNHSKKWQRNKRKDHKNR